MSISFRLQNTLEAKVRSQKDTTGMRKIKIIDDFSLNGSYNFVADSLGLSDISASLRTTIVKNLGLNVTARFDPYRYVVEPNGTAHKIDKLAFPRLTYATTSFGYSFSSSKGPAMNDINSGGAPTPQQNEFFNNQQIEDPNMQRMMMTSQYYDFSIPWNFGFNYSFTYTKAFNESKINQTLNFNASVTPTAKWGITYSGGYDFTKRALTTGMITITRDLHCWQMNFSWVPTGTYKSWSFNISVKASTLRDLKYDRRSSRFDNLFDD